MSAEIRQEIVLPRRVKAQPTPDLVGGGDCGACVLGGALDLSIEDVYDKVKGERHCIGHSEMARMLRVAESHGLTSGIVESPAAWDSWPHWDRAFGHPAYLETQAWFRYVLMAMQAGYYGLAQVDADKGGMQTNHWVLIVGARYVSIPPATCPGAYEQRWEVLISDSRRSAGGKDEWVSAWNFLKESGGYSLLLVRPA